MGAFLDDDCCLDDSPDSRSLGVRIRCRYRFEGNLKMLYLFIKQIMYRYTQTCQLRGETGNITKLGEMSSAKRVTLMFSVNVSRLSQTPPNEVLNAPSKELKTSGFNLV
jgi:hypothetical protein